MRANQSTSVLEELSAQSGSQIVDPVVSKSGQIAFTFGDTETNKKRPRTLPPLKKNKEITYDKIQQDLKAAESRKQVSNSHLIELYLCTFLRSSFES